MATVALKTSDVNLSANASHPTPPQTVWLVNAAFLQEIKDSNPLLWHEFHHLRTLCQLDPDDTERPQHTIKQFVLCLDKLRDLIALQFALEESYGLIATTPPDSPYDRTMPDEIALNESNADRQSMITQIISQHRCLYLQMVDLVEQAEELQYRGCDVECLRKFADRVEQFSRDLTAHERIEGELIRLHGSHSGMPSHA